MTSGPNDPYGPPPGNPYGQPFGQPPGNPYGQPPANPYGQPPANPYGQPLSNPYGQPPANPYGPPSYPYGQPPTNPYGPPAPNPYGPPGTGPYGPYVAPPRPGGGSRGLIIALVVVAAIVVAGVVAYAVNNRNQNEKGTAAASSSSNSASSDFGFGGPTGSSLSAIASPGATDEQSGTDTPPSPTGTAAPPDGPSIPAAKAVADRYFSDLNSRNRTDARTLICAEELSQFDDSVSRPDNDFTITWSNLAYVNAGAVGTDVTVLTYNTTLSKNSQSKNVTVRLYLVDENGAKICGEGTA